MMDLALVREESGVAAGALVTAAWEGVVLTTALAVGLRMFRGLSAGVRSAVWTATLVLVVLLPAGAVLMPHRAAAAGASSLRVSADWAVGLVAAWTALAAFRIAALAASAIRLREVGRRAVPVATGPGCAALLGGGRRVAELCVSGDVDRPSIVGFFRPRVLLPAAMLAELRAAELEQIVRHEMEHLHRRDDWTNLLQKVSCALLPLSPAVLWLDRRMSIERELACDDGVLRQTRAPKAYAACLTTLAEGAMLRRGSSLALSAWERQSELSRRVHRILRWRDGGMSRRAAGAVASVLLLGATVGSVELARTPQVLRFADAAPAMAEVRRPVMGGDAMVPVMVRVGADAVRPVLMPAVMPARSCGRFARTAGMRARRRSGTVLRVRQTGRRAPVLPAMIPRVMRTSWQGREVGFPAAARMVLTGDEDVFPRYAAIATGDGWLIVQL